MVFAEWEEKGLYTGMTDHLLISFAINSVQH